MIPDRKEFVRFEVQKLLVANIIKEVHYSDWLTKVVLDIKENGHWHLCIDYTIVNLACLKDPYLLPPIDELVDATM